MIDVVLLTGLPATEKRMMITCQQSLAGMVRQRVQEKEKEELKRMKVKSGSKDNHVYKKFIGTMVYISEKNIAKEQLKIWLKLYTWLALNV